MNYDDYPWSKDQVVSFYGGKLPQEVMKHMTKRRQRFPADWYRDLPAEKIAEIEKKLRYREEKEKRQDERVDAVFHLLKDGATKKEITEQVKIYDNYQKRDGRFDNQCQKPKTQLLMEFTEDE